MACHLLRGLLHGEVVRRRGQMAVTLRLAIRGLRAGSLPREEVPCSVVFSGLTSAEKWAFEPSVARVGEVGWMGIQCSRCCGQERGLRHDDEFHYVYRDRSVCRLHPLLP